jgi:hypothetical protein
MIRIALASLFAIAGALLMSLAPAIAHAAVPVRLSVKFILDAQGNRGTAAGNLVLDQDVQDQVDRANEVLLGMESEFRVELLEIVDLPDHEYHHADDVTDSLANIYNNAFLLHAANPLMPDRRAEYAWRDDAINLYITGDADGSGAAYLPGRNHIAVMGQGANATTLAHEIGHNLDLLHTFEGGGDGCSDTLIDRNPRQQTGSFWGKDEIANENFGINYASLDATQQRQVDEVFSDVMSYHDSNNRSFLSGCQMGRKSAQAWDDRDWLVTRRPVYVDPAAGAGGNSGSWPNPYATLDEAIVAGNLGNRVMVLLEGTHSMSSPLSAPDLEVMARRGDATVHEDVAIWTDPPDPTRSEVAEVVAAMRDLQAADRARDAVAAIEALRRGEASASGEERVMIRLKLAQRLRHAGQLEEALERYLSAAAETRDPEAAAFAQHWAGRMRAAVDAATGANEADQTSPTGGSRDPEPGPSGALDGSAGEDPDAENAPPTSDTREEDPTSRRIAAAADLRPMASATAGRGGNDTDVLTDGEKVRQTEEPDEAARNRPRETAFGTPLAIALVAFLAMSVVSAVWRGRPRK